MYWGKRNERRVSTDGTKRVCQSNTLVLIQKLILKAIAEKNTLFEKEKRNIFAQQQLIESQQSEMEKFKATIEEKLQIIDLYEVIFASDACLTLTAWIERATRKQERGRYWKFIAECGWHSLDRSFCYSLFNVQCIKNMRKIWEELNLDFQFYDFVIFIEYRFCDLNYYFFK